MPLANHYGHFSEDGREYVIERPDTPMPWVNILTNGDYGLVLSQAGGGYSWRTHASLNRITRWEQDLVRDEWGKFLYIRDRATGEFWSPTWQPAGTALEGYQVRHGMGYSIISGVHSGIASELTCFVPPDDPVEVWLLRLRNTGSEPRHLQIFSYFEWLLGAAPDWHREFHSTFIETRYNREHAALLASKVLWELPGASGAGWNRDWPYVGFHSASLSPDGFDNYKLPFLGRHGHVRAPEGVIEGRSQGTQGRWGDAIASLQLAVPLEPGADVEVAFILGAADDEAQALDLVERYRKPGRARAALEASRTLWQTTISGLVVETPDEALNLLANGWLQYQVIAGRLWGRTAYYQTGGAFGFRDQLQDSLIWLLLGKPERTLDQNRVHAAHQYAEGIVLHWWHPLAEWGLKSGYSDDLLWLPFAVAAYLRETADFACLDEVLPFYDEGSATLLEHCRRAFEVALGRRSPRGLPLILHADWNDGMNAVGDGGKGESVWMAHFLHYLLTEFAALPAFDEAMRDRFRHEAAALREATNTHAWDGDWYWRATTDDGKLVGSRQCREGQIFLNAQTWSILGGLATPEKGKQAMQAARERLYKPYGALLLAPAYSSPDPEIGYLTRYAPGVRENGGVYVHASCWAVLAEAQMGEIDRAYRLWRGFCPAVRGEEPDAYMGEPYVMPGNVEGPASEHEGRGAWTWYTGSAQWYLRALVDGVLGVQATVAGLRVRPGLPDGWEGYRIARPFRGAQYDIRVRRAQPGEATSITVNGQQLDGETLPLPDGRSEVRVEVTV